MLCCAVLRVRRLTPVLPHPARPLPISFVTFDGLAKACAQAMGFREPELVHYNPKGAKGRGSAFTSTDVSAPAPLRRRSGVAPCCPHASLMLPSAATAFLQTLTLARPRPSPCATSTSSHPLTRWGPRTQSQNSGWLKGTCHTIAAVQSGLPWRMCNRSHLESRRRRLCSCACDHAMPPGCSSHNRAHATAFQAMEDLDWAPEFGLLEGLMDSYDKDFGRGTYRKEPDYTTGVCLCF